MYITIDNLLKDLTQAEIAELTGSAINSDGYLSRVQSAIDNAEATINAYLSTKYNIPISEPIPELFIVLAVALAIYNLYENFYKTTEVPKTIFYRKNEAIKMLDYLQSGKISINNESNTVIEKPINNLISNKTSESRIFSSDFLDAYFS